MKVKISRETNDGYQMQWYTGTISNVKAISESINYDEFLSSLWQILEVLWYVFLNLLI